MKEKEDRHRIEWT